MEPYLECNWCRKPTDKLYSARDFNEGMYGPTYLVCIGCINKQTNDSIDYLEENNFFDYN